MIRIVILTGSELRHVFFRKYVAAHGDIQVTNSYCEGLEKSLYNFTSVDRNNYFRLKHLEAREQTEEDFFKLFIESQDDDSRPVPLPKGQINDEKYTQKIIDSNPDLLICYGSSIIKEPLLTFFKNRFLNVHLGLSPYYRGSGTNYWPFVNEEPEYAGATFMHIDAGIDTGEIIHQIRPKCSWNDTPSQIGTRFIVDMAREYLKIIINFNSLPTVSPLDSSGDYKLYRTKDYSEDSAKILYENFENGLIKKYLEEEEERCAKVPIINNPAL